ncbi:MAG TPA: PAS domain S-box protein [Chryseosolibacter sp.]|nr:PAS domain S-box protein [Chryseosolibacter sp.]
MPRKSGQAGSRKTPQAKAKKTNAPKPALKKGKVSKTQTNTKEREQNLIPALAAARIGLFEWDIRSNEVRWSDNVHQIFGLTDDAFDGTFETYINLIHHADRKGVTVKLENAVSKGQNCDLEHRLIWLDGSIHWIAMIGNITLDKQGRSARMMGTIQDVTRRKQVELEREDWKTRYEMIAASAGVIIYDYDIPSGNIAWSGNIDEVLGYKPLQLGNIDTWVELIHPEDREAAFNLLEKAQEDLAPYDVYYRFRKNSGEHCYMHDRGFFIADQKGAAVRMLGMMSDVSERLSTEQVILENSQFRGSVESAMPGILYVFDNVNRKVIYANQSSSLFLGYKPDELVQLGNNFVPEIIHEDDHRRITRWFTEPDGTVKENEIRMKRKDGQYRWFMTRDTPFRRDENGKVIQIVGIAQDITMRKEVLSQLNTSEQSYRELFDTVTDAIYILNESLELVDLNKGACALFGCEKKKMIGNTLDAMAASDSGNLQMLKTKSRAAFEGGIESFELWCRRKDGTSFLQEFSLSKGTYFGKDMIIATGRDITSRKRAEEALRESEQRFRTLQQASFGGIGLHDRGIILDCNQGLSDLTGYDYDELKGMNGLNLIAPDWRDFVLEKIVSGYDKTYDAEGIRKDGSKFILEIHGKNIPFEGRTIRVTEFRDITERKKAEEKIVEQNTRLTALTDDLLRKNNQLEEFTQIVSHNLRSPVGNIVTLLNFYENAETEIEKLEYFNLLKESSSTTLAMLNDLNEVLKIKQNKKIEKDKLHFETVLHQVIKMLNARISQLSANVSFDFSKAPVIQYPGVYLESIFLNLLDNALKYAHPERNPVIRFSTSLAEGKYIVLSVSDNGLGLNLSRYKHQLFKLRKTFHRHPESRGIGLFMVKNQVEAMGGEIWVDSVEHEGTTFFINFNKHQTDGF